MSAERSVAIQPEVAAQDQHLSRTASAAALTAVAWMPSVKLELDEWVKHGMRLGVIGRACAWWIGDWLRYGNLRYGEKYSRATQITGYDVKTLRNMVYVASRFDISRRRSNLSWSHHAVVAALSPEEQERWLELSDRERMSVRCLRLELSHARRQRDEKFLTDAGEGDSISTDGRLRAAADEESDPTVCPACGCRFSPKESGPADLPAPGH